MAEEDLQRFLKKVRDLQAFVAASEADPALRERLTDCSTHQEVVDLAAAQGFAIGRRWGERPPAEGNLLAAPGPAAGQESTTVLRQESCKEAGGEAREEMIEGGEGRGRARACAC